MLMHMAHLSHTICSDAEGQHLFPPLLPVGLGALGSRSGWSCLGNMEVVLSCFSKVPDFGLMLMTVSLVVKFPSTAEQEEARGVKDRTLAQQFMGVLPPGTF